MIVPVNCEGVARDTDASMALTSTHNLFIVEDTAGALGGVNFINDERFIERAEIIREKGTNRSQFFRGSVDKYSWVDIGSSYLPSEIQAAYLYGQLLMLDKINQSRLISWQLYFDELSCFARKCLISLPFFQATLRTTHICFI